MHCLSLVAILLAGAVVLGHNQPIIVYDVDVDEESLFNTLQERNRQFFLNPYYLSSLIVVLYFQKKTSELPVKCRTNSMTWVHL